jgi:hypothetical protein
MTRARVPARALAAIPDTPATVETRALALDDATYVHAIGAGWRLIAGTGDLACVFGGADPVAVDTILDVAGFDGDLLVPGTDAPTVAALAGRWSAERALIFTMSSAALRSVVVAASPGRAPVDVRPLSLQVAPGQVPADLREEIGRAATKGEISAAFCNDTPVSFAYVSLETERHGDLSVDTLDAFRRRGSARRHCVP